MHSKSSGRLFYALLVRHCQTITPTCIKVSDTLSRFQIESRLLVTIEMRTVRGRPCPRNLRCTRSYRKPSYPEIDLVNKLVTVIVWRERKRSHWFDQLQCYYIQSLKCRFWRLYLSLEVNLHSPVHKEFQSVRSGRVWYRYW